MPRVNVMEFVCTPTRNNCSVRPYGSRLKKNGSRSRLAYLDNKINRTPDRFIPRRSADDLRCEYSAYELSRSVRKDKKKNSPLKNNLKQFFPSSSQNIQRMLTFDSPIPNEQGYWGKYAIEKDFTMLKKRQRKIKTTPDNVLNAPDVIDDFYLNLLHWGCTESLAVGLGYSVYLLRPHTLEANALFTLSNGTGCFPSAVRWNASGHDLAVGFSNGETQIWDISVCKLKCSIKTHSSRIGCLSWYPESHTLLSSGSQLGDIHNYDCRIGGESTSYLTTRFKGHTMDVCSLQWSPTGQYLASGGNDNIVNIWRGGAWDRPILSFDKHTAAVKALSWCPWRCGFIASGGGTADKTLHLWNTATGKVKRTIRTNSQISGIMWSQEYRELLTTHGYEENALMIWDPEILQEPVAILRGHTGRILHSSCSPDGQEVASLSADQTLRIWKCFATSNGKRSLDFDTASNNIGGSFERELLAFGLN